MTPVKETFAEFLKTLGTTAKQVFGDKASEFVENFLFLKLPKQTLHDLFTAG